MKRSISSKQAKLLCNILVSVAMTVVMTGGMLLIHDGYSDRFFILWLSDFIVGCFIAIPTGLLLAPSITKWIEGLVKEVSTN
jgi:hypothetical protein